MVGTSEHRPTSAFDYALPEHLVARYPAERRDRSRLLVLRRDTGAISHSIFDQLTTLVSAGDAVVLNETRVFPARLVGRKPTGAPGEVLLLRPWSGVPRGAADARGSGGSETAEPAEAAEAGDGPDEEDPGRPDPRLWEALVRPGGKLKPGRVLDIAPGVRVEMVDSTPGGGRVVRLVSDAPVEQVLERHGHVPLPPYLEREDEAVDRERYQTVYARRHGSVAAPTAGLHFTPELLQALEQRGVRLVRLTLHVGVGTFRPVETEDPAAHSMHSEYYDIDAAAAATVNEVRSEGGAVWAVGTTVVRTLETAADEGGTVRPGNGWTDLFIRPGYRFRAVDRLITNFHLPRSTLLMLVAAFGGYRPVMRAYEQAIEQGYRFYSYGDAMAVL